MKKTNLLLLAVGMLLAVSCAKKTGLDYDKLSDESFEAWMERHGDGAVRQPSGIYTKVLQEVQANARKPKDGDWIKINYTGRALGDPGNVFVTRDSVVAKNVGTFSYFTHFTPQYIPMQPNVDYLIQGQYEALSMMKEGEKWRVYMPSRLAYGAGYPSYESGYRGPVQYEGQELLAPYSPIVMDIELVNVIPDPETYENQEVIEYATTKWNKALNDTIAPGFYMRRLDKWGDGPKVNADSTASIFYVARTLDGYVWKTIIADTARKHGIYSVPSDSETYPYSILDITFDDELNIDGLDDAVKAMEYGETAQAVFTSKYGYGEYGYMDDNGNTLVQPYTPLLFDIFVSPIGGNGTSMFPYWPDKGVNRITAPQTGKWVTGVVVGVGNPVPENVPPLLPMDNCQFKGSFSTKTNILIGNNTSDANLVPSKVIPVELPDGSDIQKLWNLVDNPDLIGTQVLFYGDIVNELGAFGLSNVTQYNTPSED